MQQTTMATPTKLTIDVWADVVCPWCYLGEHRLNQAIEHSPYAAHIELKVHTFQLDAQAPTTVVPTVEYAAAKIGLPIEQSRAMGQKMARLAQAEGLRFEIDRPAGNTLDMLRLVHYGAEHGVAFAYLRAMQAEVFGGSFDAYEHTTLTRIGEELGMPADGIGDVLTTDRYADAVRADREQAAGLGVTGVPFTVIGQRPAIPGAVSTEQYTAAINQAWQQAHG